MKHQVDVPPDRQQFIGPLLALLILSVPGVLLGQQGLDLCRQCLGGGGCHSARAIMFHPLSEDLSGDYSTPGLFCCFLLPPFGIRFHSERVNTQPPIQRFFYMPFPLAAGVYVIMLVFQSAL